MQTLQDILKTFEKRSSLACVYRTGVRRFEFSYRDIYDSVTRMAQWLSVQGIGKGDRVVIWAPNSPWWGVAYWAVIVRGGIVVPVDFMSDKARAESITTLSGAKLIIQSQYKLDRLDVAQHANLASITVEGLEYVLPEHEPLTSFADVQPDDVVELVYTSGTTGNPKGVKLTHKNLATHIGQLTRHVTLDPKYRYLSLLPLSHMFEQMGGFLIPAATGGMVVYMRTLKPSAIMESLGEEDISVVMIVPRLLQALKLSIERELDSKGLGNIFAKLFAKAEHWSPKMRKLIFTPINKKFGRHFQFFVSGGAALDPETAHFWKRIGFKILEGYGLTETSPVLAAHSMEEQPIGAVGKALNGVELDIRDGEIVAKGANIFPGYWENEEATRDAFTEDGWFKTGDMGSFDAQGNLVIKGRAKEMIVTGSGVNVYPDDIEPVLNAVTGVKDSCIIALDRGHGEEVHAVLILSPTLEGGDQEGVAADIIKQTNSKLDSLQHISGYTLWPEAEFPKTTTLKVKKFEVKKRIQESGDREQGSVSDGLTSIISKVTGKPVSEIHNESVLVTNLGLTSVARLELVTLIEQEFRLDIEDTAITQKTTVKDLRTMIAKREKRKGQRSVRTFAYSSVAKLIRVIADYVVFRWPFLALIKIKSEGRENLKQLNGPVIFIANHPSYLDGPAIYWSLPWKYRYRMAPASWDGLFYQEQWSGLQKLIGRLFYEFLAFFGGCFLISQDGAFRQSLQHMGELIDNDVSILFFPEGGRPEDGKMQPFMKGLGIVAKELKVPVVPIKLIGAEKVMTYHSLKIHPGTITVRYGKPLNFTRETPAQIIEITEKVIREL